MKLLKHVDPTRDSILKSIVYLSIPMMLEMLAQNFFNLVDTYFVSRISYLAIGALVSCSVTLMVVFSLFIGLSTATGIYVSSFWGARKFSRAYYYYANAFSIVLASGFAFGLVMFLSINPILDGVGLKGVTKAYAYQYLSIASFGVVFNFMFSLNNSTLRSIASPGLVVKVMVLANILNTIFDPFFIFCLKLGIKGAAFSTIVSVVIGIALQFFYLRKNGFYCVIKFKASVIKNLVRKGVFASLHLLFRITSMLVLIRMVSSFSEAVLSAYSTVIRIYQVLFFLVFGLANASFVIVGQNYGARFIDRAKKGAFGVILAGLVFIGLLDILLYVLRYPVLSLFINNVSVKLIANQVMFYYFISYPFVVVGTIASRSSMALRDTKRPSIINLVNLWMFMLPLAYVLSKSMGTDGIWLAIALSNATSFVANFILLKINFRRVEREVVPA